METAVGRRLLGGGRSSLVKSRFLKRGADAAGAPGCGRLRRVCAGSGRGSGVADRGGSRFGKLRVVGR